MRLTAPVGFLQPRRSVSNPEHAHKTGVRAVFELFVGNALHLRRPAPVLQKASAAGMWIVAVYMVVRNLPGFSDLNFHWKPYC